MMKKKKSKYQKKLRDLKLKTYFNVDELETFILYLFTDSNLINRKALSNLKKLFTALDDSIYEAEPDQFTRVFYIREVLDAKLRLNINDFYLLLDYPSSEYHNEFIEESIKPLILSNEEGLAEGDIKYVTKKVSEILKYSYLVQNQDMLMESLDKLQMGDYGDIAKINDDMKQVMQLLMKEMRNVEVDDERSAEFDLSEESMDTVLADIVNELTQPSNKLKTGIKWLNKMLNGGFESSRIYIFFAIPGMGKSLLLLTLAYHLMKYNSDLQPKDPNKKLSVLYITQENSLKETIERLWKIAISDEEIIEFSFDQVKQAFKDAGLILGDGNAFSNINLRIKYAPHKQISTDDLYSIIDDLHDSGEEVISVIHDYTKRIRPSSPTGDIRVDLGEVVNEEANLAKFYDIPFITAGQINRSGATIIEEALEKSKEDMGKLLNAHNIGESFLMYENMDAGFIITREFKPNEENYYLSIKEIKSRNKKLKVGEPNLTYFVHPYEKNNPARLVEDINLDHTVSRLKLSESDTDATNNNSNKSSNGNFTPRKKSFNRSISRSDESIIATRKRTESENDFDDLD